MANDIATVRDRISGMAPQFRLALPSHIDAEKYIRVVLTAMATNQKLYKCSIKSLMAACMRLAEMGLYPDGRQGALIPRWNKKTGTYEASGQAMYQGRMDLARRTGLISDIFVATIYERDEWSYELGFHRDLVHRPCLDVDRGHALAYYCIVEFKDGTKTFGPGPISKSEMDRLRDLSQDGLSEYSPWAQHYEAMAWSKAINRTLKYCPQSPELVEAIKDDDVPWSDDLVEPTKAGAPQSRSQAVIDEVMSRRPPAQVTNWEGKAQAQAQEEPPKKRRGRPPRPRVNDQPVIEQQVPEHLSAEDVFTLNEHCTRLGVPWIELKNALIADTGVKFLTEINKDKLDEIKDRIVEMSKSREAHAEPEQ